MIVIAIVFLCLACAYLARRVSNLEVAVMVLDRRSQLRHKGHFHRTTTAGSGYGSTSVEFSEPERAD